MALPLHPPCVLGSRRRRTPSGRAHPRGRPLKTVYKPISVGGREPVDVCLFPEAGDEVTPWLLEHDWIDEPVQRAFLDHVQPGMRVLDLGCHLGLFSLSAARLGAAVIAFDAVAMHCRQVRLAAEHNGFADFRVVHGVIAATADRRSFVQSSIHSHVFSAESSKFIAPDGTDTVIEVPGVVVDDVLDAAGWDSVDVIKMDIEGTEVDALKGMARLFARGARPVVVFECNGGMLPIFETSPARLRGWFARRGYSLWLIDHLHPGTLVEADAMPVQPEAVIDYMALPDGASPPPGWTLAPPLTREQLVTRLLDQATVDHWWFRSYVSDLLPGAPAWVRDDPLVESARNALAEDIDGTVREHTAPASARRRWTPADEPPDPELAIVARDVAIPERPEILARALGQRRPASVPLLLDHVSFHVRRGTFVGLLGVHAHELATFMATIAGRLPIVDGTLDVRGRVLQLSRVSAGLEPALTVAENITVYAAFLGRDARAATARADAIVERAGLVGHLDDPLGDQAADLIARLALTLLLEEPRHDIVLLDGLPRTLDGGFADWAWERTEVLRRSGVAIVQAATDAAQLLGRPDRMLYLTAHTLRAAGHPGSVEDLFRRHALGLPDREVR